VFETPAEVISALKRYRDAFDPRTTSIITPFRNGHDPHAEPFRAGFLGSIQERDELLRRLTERIAVRERALLLLWYIADLPVARIARRLGISRIHCYRLRKQAIDCLCDDPGRQAAGSEN
jgi:DNA-directed RNA polymerase specialized sigma24 family protein